MSCVSCTHVVPRHNCLPAAKYMSRATSNGSDDALLEFLKKFSSIPNEFIDDLFSFYDPETSQNEPAIDTDLLN